MLTEQVNQEEQELDNQEQEETGSVVENILSQYVNEEPEEVEGEELEEVEEEEPIAQPAGIVTAELAAQYPILKSYIGKSLEDVAKAYDNLTRKASRDSTELQDLRRKSTIDPDVEILRSLDNIKAITIDDIPDYDVDPKGHDKAIVNMAIFEMKKYITSLQKTIQPIIEPVRRQSQERIVAQIEMEVAKVVPKEEFQKTIVEWKAQYEDGDPQLEYFKANPDKLVRDIIKYYKSINYDKFRKQKTVKDMNTNANPIGKGIKSNGNLPTVIQEIMQRQTR